MPKWLKTILGLIPSLETLRSYFPIGDRRTDAKIKSEEARRRAVRIAEDDASDDARARERKARIERGE